MVSIRLRLIREHNRLYKFWMRLLWRICGLNSPIVLMVHGFKPSKELCKNSFEMTGASFERIISYLMNSGWIAMTREQLLNRQWRRKSFYLTFDDTYDTVYSEAYPILKRHQIPFTMFVTKDLVDKPGFITSNHLKELAIDKLCTIGGHGMQHAVFRNLTEEETTRQCREEQKWFKEEFGISAELFAFPYGRIVEVSGRNRRQLRNMGYKMVFSAIEGTLQSSWFTGIYFLPRVNVSEKFVEKFTAGKFPKFKDCEGR